MKKLSILCSSVLAFFLACCYGDGRALEGWALGYAALLAYLTLLGLYYDFRKKEKRCSS